MRCFGYYIVKALAKPEWCTLNTCELLSVSENGLSCKFPDLEKCFYINCPKSEREKYKSYLGLNAEEFSEFCDLVSNLFSEKRLTTDARFCRFEDAVKMIRYIHNADDYKIYGLYADEDVFDVFESEGYFKAVKPADYAENCGKSIGWEILGSESAGADYYFNSYIINSLNEIIESKCEIELKADNKTGLIQNSYEEIKEFCKVIQGMGEPVLWLPFEIYDTTPRNNSKQI